MRSRFSLVTALAATVAFSGVSYAQNPPAMRMETIEGVLVDAKCYGMMPKENAGNDHMVEMHGKMSKVPGCAAACANLGIPVALKTKDNKTIVLAAPANQLAGHMAQQVKLEGMPSKDKATFIVMRVAPASGEPFEIKTMM